MIRKIAAIVFAVAVLTASADTWSNCTIKSLKLTGENNLSFRVISANCSPCDVVVNYWVNSGWPSHTTAGLKQYQALLMGVVANGQKINIDFSWNGADGGTYHVNWIEVIIP